MNRTGHLESYTYVLYCCKLMYMLVSTILIQFVSAAVVRLSVTFMA